jgi:hypothetical protein
VKLRIRSVAPPEISCEVVVGGCLSSHKGVTLPWRQHVGRDCWPLATRSSLWALPCRRHRGIAIFCGLSLSRDPGFGWRSRRTRTHYRRVRFVNRARLKPPAIRPMWLNACG